MKALSCQDRYILAIWQKEVF